jgi:uncharacterized protein (TIGR02270 family)
MIIPDVIEQHWEEGGILWSRRCSAVGRPSFGLRTLSQLDERMEAHLDALRIADKEGWELCLKTAAWEDGGEAFVLGVLAFAAADEARFKEIAQHAVAEPLLARGLVSALDWLDVSVTQFKIQELLNSKSPIERRIGLAAAAAQRMPLNGALTEALKNDDELLRARACRAVGELGRLDLARFVLPQITSGNEDCAFWAVWSLALLAPEASVLNRLRDFVAAGESRSKRAADILFRRLPVGTAMDYQRQLAQNAERARLAINVAGIIGDPALVPWLLDQMNDPKKARLAAHAFQTITGADFVMDRLRNPTPPRPSVAEDAGEDQPPEPDGDLECPDVEAIRRWWAKNKERFNSGTRYLLGKTMAVEWLREVLALGQQDQRAAAALELATRQPGQVLFNVAAPAVRQEAMLRKRDSKK